MTGNRVIFGIILCLAATQGHAETRWDRFHRIVCSRTDVHHIRDDDPALRFFRHKGYPLKDAKIDLAVERANGCQNAIDELHSEQDQ